MGYYYALTLPVSIFILLCHCEGLLGERLQVSETNMTKVFVDLLRGRDGLPGRDGPSGPEGPRGPSGPQGMAGSPGPLSGGATYIRWGRSICPDVSGTQLVYTGFAGGSWHSQGGGGANYLCLPKVPEYNSTLTYDAGAQSHSPIHGAEYENGRPGINDNNVPCAVCRVSTRPTVLMTPAMASCHPAWTREYHGYLMSEHKGHARTTFVCVDEAMEGVVDSYANTNGALFYHTEAHCGTGLPCPPYSATKELNCVVCTM